MDAPVINKMRFLHLSPRLLRTFGAWPDLGNFSTWSERGYHVFSLVMVSFIFTDLVIKFYGLVNVWFHTWVSLESFLEDAAIFFTGVVMFSKMIIVITSQRSLRDVIERLNGLMLVRYIRTQHDGDLMKACRRHELHLTYLLMSYTYMLGTMYALSPAIRMLQDWRSAQIDNATVTEGYLPMKYPFHLRRTEPLYLLLLLFQLVVVLLTSNLSVVPDSLFASLFHYLSGHLDILCHRLTTEPHNSGYRECIRQHHDIIKLADDVIELSQSMIIVQLFFSSLLICLGVFELSLVQDPVLYIKFILYFLIKFSLLFLYCWHGEELMEKSAKLADVCYDTNWYSAKPATQRDAKLLMVRSQKPLALAAGGLLTLSLSTFMNVLRAAYSYFTLLQTMHAQE